MFDSVRRSKPKKMLQRIHGLIDEADAIVHYNGMKFDMPTLNKEFVSAGMTPPSPYKQVDLYQTARTQFRFPSNKLDYIVKTLGIGEKTRNRGHELWTECMAGREQAWKEMEKYNRQDVHLLELLYDKLMPWIRSHPNHGTYDEPGRHACPNCGSTKLQRRGYSRSLVNKFARYQCTKCGGWSKEPLSEFSTEDRQRILRKDN